MEKGLIIFIVTSESCGVEDLVKKATLCHQMPFNSIGKSGFVKDVVKISFDKRLEDGITIKVSSREELELGDKGLSDIYCQEFGEDIAKGIYENNGDQKIDIYLNAVCAWVHALRESIPKVQIKLKEN